MANKIAKLKLFIEVNMKILQYKVFMARTQPPEHKASTLSSSRLKSTSLKRNFNFYLVRLMN